MGRSPCCDKDGLKKGPWTPEEDQKLIDYIQKHGYGNWRTLPKNAGLERCGKSCRLRWTNYLRPDIKRGRFSFEEEETIIQLHSILGNKWSTIASRLPGRTDNEIKNYWNTHIRKRLLRMGIDPVTHSPRLDLLDLSSILNSSLYNNNNNSSQMNLSRLLGVQHLVNPELLKLASSLLSSRRENYPYFLQQQNSFQENNHLLNPQVQQNDQMPPLVQFSQFQTQVQDNIPNCTTTLSTPCVPYCSDVEQFSSNLNDFSSQNCQVNEWQSNAMPSNFTECYAPLQDYFYHASEASTFQSNNSKNFSFHSVLSNLSTPSSSPAPLNSNSTYVTGSTNTEDERESYCSDMLKFEIPNILDVNEFM